jgi:hypothetical protein
MATMFAPTQRGSAGLWTLPLVLWVIGCLAPVQSIMALDSPPLAPPTDPLRDPVGQMVFFAVLEGCFQDGVAREDIDLILPKNIDTGGVRLEEHFIWTCPLCMPVVDALRCFKERGRFLSDKAGRDQFGNGLPAEMRNRLRSTVREEQRAALQDLVAQWVRRRIELMRLAPDERITWNAAIEARLQVGEQRLKALKAGDLGEDFQALYQPWQTRCPVCDGVLHACQVATAPTH